MFVFFFFVLFFFFGSGRGRGGGGEGAAGNRGEVIKSGFIFGCCSNSKLL